MTPEEFIAKHGFPGTPAGDRMRDDLDLVIKTEKKRVLKIRVLGRRGQTPWEPRFVDDYDS